MPAQAIPFQSGSVTIETDDESAVQPQGDGIVVRLPDGAVVVDISPPKKESASKFDDNLAKEMPADQLANLAETLMQGIDADLQSRSQWESIRSKGIDLLGLKLDDPRSDLGSSSAPLEGMSTVRDSTLLEAVLKGQANAIGELLPSGGPVKVENEGEGTTVDDKLAEALERDLNTYLTTDATEYYPDTKRMFFWTYFGGSGWKKVYSCPIRRRPVSESIDANDLIISNAATDLWNAGRITHRITMRPSVMKRMQFLGVYRDVELTQPQQVNNKVDDKKEAIEGVQNSGNIRPEDQPYTLYECYCEYDLDEYAPQQFKGEGIPLPYRVTIDKDSRQILEVHRNWKEDDEACLPRKYFVRYPYIEGMGIYGIGLVNVLGNAAAALTGAEREMLDAGMFACFPGFLFLKQATKQLTNEFRVAPGSGVPIQSESGRIGDAVMPLPYKDITPGLLNLWNAIKEDARRLGGTADLPVGEGVQNAPVGTILAMIEQATKVESAVHKGFYFAQSEEFQLLKERFIEDPEAFWRHKPKSQWTKETFLAALQNVELTPKADPNTPSHMHRIAKAMAIEQMATASPTIYDRKEVDSYVFEVMKVSDYQRFFSKAAPSGPDPNVITATAKLITAQNQQQKNQTDAQLGAAKIADGQAERKSKEDIETTKLAQAVIVHGSNQAGQAFDQMHQTRQHDLAATDSAHNRVMDIYDRINPPEPAGSSTPKKARGGSVGETPPIEGAKKAKDGKWYVPDPRAHRKGKWMLVDA